MDDINDALWFAVLAAILLTRRSVVFLTFLLYVVSQVPLLHKILQVGLEALTLIGSVHVLLVIGAELALISGGGVTFHRLWPLEEGLRLNFAKEPIDWLLKDCVHRLEGGSFVP